jgi:hypothetical protein
MADDSIRLEIDPHYEGLKNFVSESPWRPTEVAGVLVLLAEIPTGPGDVAAVLELLLPVDVELAALS